MNVRFVRSLLIAVAFLLMGASVFAHHGTGVSYDPEHPIVLNGTIAEFRYTNPHVQLYFDVKDEKGQVTRWSAEGADPASFIQGGWSKKRTLAALAPGTEIKITLNPARNGKPVGNMRQIVFSNGEVFCGLGAARNSTNCRQEEQQPAQQ